MAEVSNSLIRRFLNKMEALTASMEKANIAEFIELFQNPVRMMTLNFLSGVTRGLGIGVGVTIATAIVILILGRLVELNLPLIGSFIAEIAEIVQAEMNDGPAGP